MEMLVELTSQKALVEKRLLIANGEWAWDLQDTLDQLNERIAHLTGKTSRHHFWANGLCDCGVTTGQVELRSDIHFHTAGY